LYFLSDALGPRLGKAFLDAYDKGELGKAAALIKASEVSTGAAKKHFDYKRPFLIQGNTIHQVPDDVVVKDNKPYSADGGSFPSGHTNTGYTDALLMAEMIPERFDSLVERGARYGYSRIVLGVHYPLDVMGSRMVAQRNVAHYLNDPRTASCSMKRAISCVRRWRKSAVRRLLSVRKRRVKTIRTAIRR
jgi:membrane-associated phospholipid phosphatase